MSTKMPQLTPAAPLSLGNTTQAAKKASYSGIPIVESPTMAPDSIALVHVEDVLDQVSLPNQNPNPIDTLPSVGRSSPVSSTGTAMYLSPSRGCFKSSCSE